MEHPVKIITLTKEGKKKSYIKNTKTTKLEGYIEVYPDNLKYLYGVWIKNINKTTREISSGGFIILLDYYRGIVSLRNPRVQEPIELEINANKFYVSSNCENYKALKNIQLDKDFIRTEIQRLSKLEEKLKEKEYSLNILNKELQRFQKIREKFITLVSNGKVRIL